MNDIKTKLITLFVLAGLLAMPMAFAVPARVDFNGNITSYSYDEGYGDIFGGSIGVGTDFVGAYSMDTTPTDLNPNPDIGRFSFDRIASDYSVMVGSNLFEADVSNVFIQNDKTTASGSTLDRYIGWGMTRTDNEILILAVFLADTTASVLSDGSFVTEPVLSDYDYTNFYVVSKNADTKAINYLIKGDITYLVDPPVSVPEPMGILLFGLGLLGMRFSLLARKKSLPNI